MSNSDGRKYRGRAGKRDWNKYQGQKPDSRRICDDKNKNKRQRFSAKIQQEMAENQQAIDEFKRVLHTCPKCGCPIEDILSALADKTSGGPVHFDCVMDHLRKTELLREDESLAYIGQGRFAVVVYENPHDPRSFRIRRIIEWEARDVRHDWRTQIAGLYSQVR